MISRQIFLVVLVPLVLLVSACGQVDDDNDLILVCALALDENCRVSDNPNDCISRGLLDLNHPAFGGEPVYYLSPLVIGSPENEEVPIDAMYVPIRKTTLSYEWLDGRGLLMNRDDWRPLLDLENGSFDIYTSGVVSASGGAAEKTEFRTLLRAIPSHVGARLPVLGEEAGKFTLGVRIRVSAEGPDGTWLRSNDFLFPINLCWGCHGLVCG